MATRDELIAQYQADPRYAVLTRQNGDRVSTLGPSERDALFGQWADADLARVDREGAAAQRRELRRQVRLALTLLERPDNPATLAQVRQILAGLIRVLIGLNLIEDE